MAKMATKLDREVLKIVQRYRAEGAKPPLSKTRPILDAVLGSLAFVLFFTALIWVAGPAIMAGAK